MPEFQEVLDEEQKEKVRKERARQILERQGISAVSGKSSFRERTKASFKEATRKEAVGGFFREAPSRFVSGAKATGQKLGEFEHKVEEEIRAGNERRRRREILRRKIHRHRKSRGLSSSERKKLKMLLRKLNR